MRKVIVTVVITLLVVWLVQWGLGSLLSSIDRGKCKRWLADIRPVAAALENYKADNGFYPVGLSTSSLTRGLEPTYLRKVPTAGFSYYSDGSNYDLFLRPGGEGPYPGCVSVLQLRSGRWVAWPAQFNERNLEFSGATLPKHEAPGEGSGM